LPWRARSTDGFGDRPHEPAATASDQQWLLSCISIIQVAVTTIDKRCGDFGFCPRASYPAAWGN